MNPEPAAPSWVRAVSLWHALALIPMSAAAYVSSEGLFGEVVNFSMARLPIMLLAAALAAISLLLIVAGCGRSRGTLRLALMTAFVLDIQVSMLLFLFSFQLDNSGLLGGFPATAAPLVPFLAFAIPGAAAVFALRDTSPATDSARRLSGAALNR